MLDQPALSALLAFGGWPLKKRKVAEEHLEQQYLSPIQKVLSRDAYQITTR
jgi:hypothetical protein